MAEKTDFEIAVINQVRKVRKAKGYTQDDLAMFLNLTRGFIGQIESPKFPSKYNVEHIGILAREMNCSPKDLMPDQA
ncbi:helix-turn-helix domain-containing protein [Dyadobacter sp. CY261]|uniref:helix-turn-helix domain-containing protein n=1 Tax=Dyadobacter sp. CY261 TaxID=2907203 RepID=UPI001F29A7B5|nr:helix-turn-helix transcriptional regulator [Dyadobacter sp. CY261]MCF0073739.1 helix-turn-helix domain-containing protein [Dyadobacter sp. CY261]